MPATEARVEAQAKVNLFLRVLAREESGYHQIETLFCRIALSDTVVVREAEMGVRRLELSGARLPASGLGPADRNLAYRAAVAYGAATRFPAGFEIAIEKRIPVGGGLGGGSADAGAVLRALNALNPNPLEPDALGSLAAALGADVPFLAQDTATMAIGRGYGEKLEAVEALPSRPVWLTIPDVGVNTADAYRWLDESGRPSTSPSLTVADVASWESLARVAGNDFEPVVGRQVPIIGRLLAGLRSAELQDVLGDSAIVLMSGSGSTVAVVAGHMARNHWQAMRAISGIEIVETETADFVEQVVLTH